MVWRCRSPTPPWGGPVRDGRPRVRARGSAADLVERPRLGGACGECFEDCRLRNALTQVAGCDGRRVIDGLVAEAVDFGRGEPVPDDINLIAVSRDGA